MRRPSSVRCESLPSRRIRSPPSSPSSAWIARVRAGCETLQSSAARVKFNVCARERKYRICCISMRDSLLPTPEKSDRHSKPSRRHRQSASARRKKAPPATRKARAALPVSSRKRGVARLSSIICRACRIVRKSTSKARRRRRDRIPIERRRRVPRRCWKGYRTRRRR